MDTSLTALAISCTLKLSPASSSSDLLARQLLDALAEHGVTGDLVRAVDHDIRPGVEKDMGDGDQWPALRQRVLDADILVFVTPTWVGQPPGGAPRGVGRPGAELRERGEQGRPILFDKVAIAGVLGNEDGAHHISAILFQALNDIGYTIPAQTSVYWNGEAMQTVDYKDLDETPEAVSSAIATATRNAAHLARQLTAQAYPAE